MLQLWGQTGSVLGEGKRWCAGSEDGTALPKEADKQNYVAVLENEVVFLLPGHQLLNSPRCLKDLSLAPFSTHSRQHLPQGGHGLLGLGFRAGPRTSCLQDTDAAQG